MIDTIKLWENVLVEIELTVSKANFSTWFKDTFIMKIEEGTVYLSVPNAFAKDWLYRKFHNPILKTLRNFNDQIRALEYIITKDESRRRELIEQRTIAQLPTNELPLQNYYINKEDNLNPKYTFETFVIGPFNELAHAAAQAILKKPGIVYNPLFIYGNTGIGKTHLIQAVGNHMKTLYPQKKVFYLTSEKFGSEFFAALQNNKANTFKEKYRKYDLIIMDDIQFFSNKEKFQEELFHLFNTMHEQNKQIIFTSDKHPNFIPGLEDRLKSRFSAGMIVDIPVPDQESRVAILRSKLLQNNLTIDPEIVEFLANTIDGNIRELEGTVNTLVCHTQLKGKELNLLDVKNLIKNNAKPKKNVAVKDVIKTIAQFYNVEEGSIYHKTRRKEVVKPRQLIMYILREDFNISYPSIGEKLGGRDHTTVIHSCEKIKGELKTNSSLVQELSQIRALI
jgi:chromosomal replication initiator protein